MEQMGPLVRVKAVAAGEPYTVHILFENGEQRVVDLAPFLRGPIFQAIRDDLQTFRSVKVIGSTVGWENGADIDPDVLFYNLTPANVEQMEERR